MVCCLTEPGGWRSVPSPHSSVASYANSLRPGVQIRYKLPHTQPGHFSPGLRHNPKVATGQVPY